MPEAGRGAVCVEVLITTGERAGRGDRLASDSNTGAEGHTAVGGPRDHLDHRDTACAVVGAVLILVADVERAVARSDRQGELVLVMRRITEGYGCAPGCALIIRVSEHFTIVDVGVQIATGRVKGASGDVDSPIEGARR